MYTIDLHWIEKSYPNRSLDDLCAGLRELVANNEHAEAFCAVAYWCAAHAPEGFDADRGDVYRAFAQVIGGLDTLNQALSYNRTSGISYATISGGVRLDLLRVQMAADFGGSEVYERICEAL
jgi:hypothetical protein